MKCLTLIPVKLCATINSIVIIGVKDDCLTWLFLAPLQEPIPPIPGRICGIKNGHRFFAAAIQPTVHVLLTKKKTKKRILK